MLVLGIETSCDETGVALVETATAGAAGTADAAGEAAASGLPRLLAHALPCSRLLSRIGRLKRLPVLVAGVMHGRARTAMQTCAVGAESDVICQRTRHAPDANAPVTSGEDRVAGNAALRL